MENRFFDIDNNIYLNGLYVVALIGSEMNTYKIEVVNLKLYLLKNPNVFLNTCDNLRFSVDKSVFKQFQYSNLQADMNKYILKVQVKGLLETLNFLYSKGLVELNFERNKVKATEKCMKMYNIDVPEEIKYIAREINVLFENVAIKDIKKVMFKEGDN